MNTQMEPSSEKLFICAWLLHLIGDESPPSARAKSTLLVSHSNRRAQLVYEQYEAMGVARSAPLGVYYHAELLFRVRLFRWHSYSHIQSNWLS